MSNPTYANQGAVSIIADDALVMVVGSDGRYKPVSFANIAKAISNAQGLSKESAVNVQQGDWVRIAKIPQKSSCFSAIISVDHGWSSGTPVTLCMVVSGSGGTNRVYRAENLLELPVFNSNMSFTTLRYVEEGSSAYIEIQHRTSGYTTRIICSMSNVCNVELIDAEISSASASGIVETVNLSNLNRGG